MFGRVENRDLDQPCNRSCCRHFKNRPLNIYWKYFFIKTCQCTTVALAEWAHQEAHLLQYCLPWLAAGAALQGCSQKFFPLPPTWEPFIWSCWGQNPGSSCMPCTVFHHCAMELSPKVSWYNHDQHEQHAKLTMKTIDVRNGKGKTISISPYVFRLYPVYVIPSLLRQDFNLRPQRAFVHPHRHSWAGWTNFFTLNEAGGVSALLA